MSFRNLPHLHIEFVHLRFGTWWLEMNRPLKTIIAIELMLSELQFICDEDKNYFFTKLMCAFKYVIWNFYYQLKIFVKESIDIFYGEGYLKILMQVTSLNLLHLCCQSSPWETKMVSMKRAMVIFVVHTATEDQAEVHAMWWDRRPHGCPRSVLLPEMM